MRVHNVLKRLRVYVALTAVALWSLVPAVAPAPALAAGTLSGSSSLSATYGNTINITDLQISDTVGTTETVRLTVSQGSLSMTTTTGLTFTGGTSGAQLKFSGVLANVNAALATLRYTRTAGTLGTDSLEVSLVGANQVYNPSNGHLYEYVTSDGSQTWTAARTLSHNRTVGGATGYLATITSSDENAFVSSRLTGAGWMGASDSAAEGNWKWVEGPETGTSFWSGTGSGAAVGGQYANWSTGEPNDAGSNEDCAQYLSGGSGKWNDLPCTGTTLAGYVVEYGTPGTLPTVASKTIALNITAGAAHSVSTCAQLQTLGANLNTQFDDINLTSDIDCTGVTFVPLYGGTVYAGTFDGHGYQITNLTINRPSNDYAGLFAAANGTIKNLTLQSGSITGRDYVGAVVGEVSGSITMDHVISHLNVTGRYGLGGIAGSLYTGGTPGSVVSFTNSSATGNVTGTGTNVGGFIGTAAVDDGSVIFSQIFTTGAVSSSDDSVGGLFGFARAQGSTHASSFTVQDAYATGTVQGASGVAGLIGKVIVYGGNSYATSLTLRRTYASGAITATQYAGGLIGYDYMDPDSHNALVIDHSFAVGHITTSSSSTTGALVGYNDITSPYTITSTANYYDGPGIGRSVCSTQNLTLANCMNIDTAAFPNYFKGNHANAPMSSWDFTTIWVTNAGGYPTFLATDDGDNISAAEENAAPGSGDADGDGLLDALEANVASFNDFISGHFLTLKTSCGNLFNVQVGRESVQSGQTDIAYSYPAGLVGFAAIGCNAGATATFTQYYYGLTDPAALTLRKWNSTAGTYTTIPGAVLSTVTVGGQTAIKAVYQVTDGGPLDADGTPDGNIVDPVGLGASVVGVPNTGLGGLGR